MSNERVDDGADERLQVSRRTVVKGAAWSVPAIMIASQAPAMAASPPVDIDFEGSSMCKLPGNSTQLYCYNKGYVFWGKFQNNTGVPVYLKVHSFVVDTNFRCIVGLIPASPGAPCPPVGASCLLIETGTNYVGVFTNTSDNSASTTLTIEYSWHTENTCGTASEVGRATLTGTVIGGSWTTDAGGGSCKFPPGYTCRTPLTACGTGCAAI